MPPRSPAINCNAARLPVGRDRLFPLFSFLSSLLLRFIPSFISLFALQLSFFFGKRDDYYFWIEDQQEVSFEQENSTKIPFIYNEIKRGRRVCPFLPNGIIRSNEAINSIAKSPAIRYNPFPSCISSPLRASGTETLLPRKGRKGRSVTGHLSAYRIDRNADSKPEETKTDTISATKEREREGERGYRRLEAITISFH